jgi:glucan 1,3-beta-glucosidase
VRDFHNNSAVIGITPVNEPWWPIPIDILKEFYWESYSIVQQSAPHWISIFHDSFRLTAAVWGDFMKDCDNYALDTHIYQAWAFANPASWFVEHACMDASPIDALEQIGVPVVVGEWSLATDNCAMWLNGKYVVYLKD